VKLIEIHRKLKTTGNLRSLISVMRLEKSWQRVRFLRNRYIYNLKKIFERVVPVIAADFHKEIEVQR
jgi:hypothetical protein